LLAASVLLAWGCSDDVLDGPVDSTAQTNLGGDNGKVGDDGKGGATAKTTTKLSFDVQSVPTGPRILLEPTKTGDKTFTVRLLIVDFANLFGVATHLRYDPKALELTDLKTHELLRGPGYDARAIAKDSPKGRVLLGVARYLVSGSAFQALKGATVNKAAWATLTFKVLKPGKHTVTFDKNATIARRSDYQIVDAAWATLTVSHEEVAR